MEDLSEWKVDTLNVIRKKINEIIEVVNEVVITHPNLIQDAQSMKDFEKHMTSPTQMEK